MTMRKRSKFRLIPCACGLELLGFLLFVLVGLIKKAVGFEE